MYKEILSLVRTKDEADELLSEIGKLSSSLYKTGATSYEDALSSIRISVSNAIKKALREESIDKAKFLKDLAEAIKAYGVLKLTLAFEPSDHVIEKLHRWVVANVGANNILEVELDKTILGGAIIAFKGKYADLSLKKRLEEVLEAHE